MIKGWVRSIRRSLKRTFAFLLGLVRRGGRKTPVDHVDWSIVRRILVIRPDFRMRNLLLATSALPIIRHNFPRAQIDMLCAADYHTLLVGHPDLGNLHTFTRGELIHPLRLWRLMKRVREEDYDLVIDGTLTGAGALLAKWSGGWLRIGTGPDNRHFGFTSVVAEPPRKIWRVEAMRRYFASMGYELPERSGMHVEVQPAEQERARAKWQRMGWDEETWVTGVHIGARRGMRWTAKQWAPVINGLWDHRQPGEGVVIFHGAEDLDLLEKFEDLIPSDIPVSFSKDVRLFAALIARCRQFVTLDSGPMHLACALGVPVMSIFDRPSWTRYAPQRMGMDTVVFNEATPSAEEVLEGIRRQREMLQSAEGQPVELG